MFGFLGPNGAGKTTTVRTLGTLLAPTSGSATVAGIELCPENGPAIRSRISIMPESPGLYLRLTVTENLECFAGLYELDDVGGRIERALRAVNLENRAGDLELRIAVKGVCVSASRWRERCSTTPPCCFWTSRRLAWTPWRAAKSTDLSPRFASGA